MRKPPLQDVIVMHENDRRPPHNTNSIRQRPPSHRPVEPHRTHKREESRPREEAVTENPFEGRFAPKQPSAQKRWLIIAVVVSAVVVLTAVLLSLLFAGAVVTVYPKQDTIVTSATFSTSEDEEPGALPFTRMTLERTAVQEVTALNEEEVEERARGTITIYNDYSESPQRLIKNTRFQAEDGKIYRTRESVEVPGKNGTTPGSIETTVFAEEPGDAYNRGPSEFSVPGFVGLPQEGKVYGRSTGNMTEGFVGIRRTVEEADRMRAIESIESQLRDELLAEIAQSGDIPEGKVVFDETVFFEFSPLPDEVAQTDKVRLSLSGKVHAVLFDKEAFASRVAELTIGSYQGSPIRIDNMDDLSVSLTPIHSEDTQQGEPWEATSYTTEVNGKTKFVWEYDEDKFVQDLLGKDKTALDAPARTGILEMHPGIDHTSATIRPFWLSSFPDDPEDITVITKLDE